MLINGLFCDEYSFLSTLYLQKKNQLIWLENEENIQNLLTLGTFRTPYIFLPVWMVETCGSFQTRQRPGTDRVWARSPINYRAWVWVRVPRFIFYRIWVRVRVCISFPLRPGFNIMFYLFKKNFNWFIQNSMVENWTTRNNLAWTIFFDSSQ